MQLRYLCITVIFFTVLTSYSQSTYDAGIDSTGFLYEEYPIIPLTQIDPFDFYSKVKSLGTSDITQTKTYITGSYSDSAIIGSISAGYSAGALTSGKYSPSSTGVNTFNIHTSIAETDGDMSNNNDTITMEISDYEMSREVNHVTGGIGYNTGSGEIGNRFAIKGDTITAITFFINNPPAGDSVRVHLRDYSNGPGSLIESSEAIILSATQNWYTVPLECPAIVSDGEYLATVDQLTVGSNMSLGYTLNFFEDSSAYYNGGGGWNTLESANFFGTLIVRLHFGNIVTRLIASKDTICEGESLALQAVGGRSWAWTPSNVLSTSTGSNTIATPTQTTKVYVNGDFGCSYTGIDSITIYVEKNPVGTISEDTTICINGTASLSASGGSSYKWIGGPSNSSWNVSPTTFTSYGVLIDSTNGCNTELRTLVSVSVPEVIAYKDTTVCVGDVVNFTADRADSYQWKDGPSTSSYSYTVNGPDTLVVSGFNSLGCEAVDSVFISTHPSPTLVPMRDTGACFAQYVTVKTEGIADNYDWSTGSDSSSTVIHVLQSKNYTLKLSNGNGCSTYDTVFVERYLPPVGGIDADTTICENESITISAYGGAEYEWSSGELTQTITVSPEEETTYDVTIFSDKGCTKFEDITISLDPLAKPAFKVSSFKDSVVFTNQSLLADSFSWDFGDGNSSTEENPYNIYDTTGSYVVTLTAFNNCGGVDSSFTINVVVPQSGSVRNIAEWTNINIYPIPTSESIHYRINNNLYGDLNVRILDASGRMVHNENVFKSSNEIKGNLNLSDYAKGIYFIEFSIGDSNITKRIIKQ
jgi:PKD repeat protein